jgi:2-furoyl-CoA dehydrogenase large subunit
MIVEGQVHGAAAHGIAAVLQESLEYDEDGQLLNGTFWDYHVLTAPDMPALKTENMPQPSPFTPTGSKGMGEGGGGALHTLCAALQDAVADLGAVVTHTHNPMERVWGLVNAPDRMGVTVQSRARP